MKVFVTGGTGFIGIPLIRALLARGDEVVSLSRNPGVAARSFSRYFPEDLRARLRHQAGDLGQPAALAEGMRGCEAVFHVAGSISYRERGRREVQRTNVEGTRNVAEAARKAGVRRLVHTSSVVAVGVSWDPHQALDENAPYNCGGMGLEYFDAKHAAEVEIARAVQHGLDAVIVNPATVVGFADHAGRPGSVNDSVRLLSRVPFLLPGGNCWVDVRDVVSGHLLAFERGRTGERYILGSRNLTNAEVIRRLRQVKGKIVPRATVSGAQVRALGRVARAFERLGFPIPVGSQMATRVSGFYLYFDCAKARSELGWEPASPWPALQAMALK
jgi:dihydroflavonol-4-reductase